METCWVNALFLLQLLKCFCWGDSQCCSQQPSSTYHHSWLVPAALCPSSQGLKPEETAHPWCVWYISSPCPRPKGLQACSLYRLRRRAVGLILCLLLTECFHLVWLENFCMFELEEQGSLDFCVPRLMRWRKWELQLWNLFRFQGMAASSRNISKEMKYTTKYLDFASELRIAPQ